MRQEAEANAESDKKAKEEIEKLNAADSMIFQTEKQLKEFGDKLSEGNKSNIEGALGQLKTAHGAKDIAGIDTALEALNNAWSAASQEMYAAGGAGQEGAAGATGGNGQAGGPQGQAANDGGVTDVDYEEVDGNTNK
jgi:molecular chaperone DnaK